MSDLRVQYDDELVGADHLTKGDTLNRLFQADGARNYDGTTNYLVLNKQEADPATSEFEVALYAKYDRSGNLKPYLRDESSGRTAALG